MKKPLKVTIITNCYPPDMLVSARRWGNLVSNLCNIGVECTVIAAGDGNYDEYKSSSGERVIRLPISNRSSSYIKGQKKKDLTIRSVMKGVLFFVIPPILLNFSARRWLVQPGLKTWLIDIAHDSDCMISTYGPLGPFLLGWKLANKTGKPWIADIRDSFESRDARASWFARSWSRWLEGKILREATLRITIGKYLADFLSNTYKIDFSAIYNGWTDADIIEKADKKKSQEPYLYYAGSIYEHRIPAVSVVFEAIQNNPKIRLRMRLLNDHTNGSFNQLVSGISKPEKIELLPPVDQEIVNEELANSVGALVVEAIDDNDAMRNGTVTGKLLGLLASGMPGIAVSSKNGEIRHLVEKVPRWYGVDNPKQCIVALDNLIKGQTIQSGPQNLIDYHMTKQTERLLCLIRDVTYESKQKMTIVQNSKGDTNV